MGETAGEIETNFGTGLRSGNVGAKCLQTNLRLPKRASKRASGIEGPRRNGDLRNILIVNRSSIREQIEQCQATQAHAIFRTAFDFGLALFFDFCVGKLEIFFELRETFVRTLPRISR